MSAGRINAHALYYSSKRITKGVNGLGERATLEKLYREAAFMAVTLDETRQISREQPQGDQADPAAELMAFVRQGQR